MHKLTTYIIRCIRRLHRINKTKILKQTCPVYSGEEASDIMYESLASDEPCMIARFGDIELGCVANYLGLAEKNRENFFRLVKGELVFFGWDDRIKYRMANNTGFFNATDENLTRFSCLMLECIPNVDILGTWLANEFFVQDKMVRAKRVNLPDLEPYYHERPWSRVLQGKNVLVIHPFIKSIHQQYSRREKIFDNHDVLPEFNLITIEAIQSIADNNCGYANWFDALEAMKNKILQKNYDIAIIGCGAYGFPLASFVKTQGKKAVHLGGAVQILFGIKGRRWDKIAAVRNLYNEYWIRPDNSECVQNYKNVESGCYW